VLTCCFTVKKVRRDFAGELVKDHVSALSTEYRESRVSSRVDGISIEQMIQSIFRIKEVNLRLGRKA